MRGSWTNLGGTWGNVAAAATLGDRVYAAAGGLLWRVDRDGACDAVGDEEWHPRFLVGVAGYVVSIEPGGGMYRIDPTDGSSVELDGDWSATIAACAGGDAIFVIERSGTLFRVEPADGSYHAIADGFDAAQLVTAAGGALLTVEHDGLYRISPKTGAWELLSSGWHGVGALAGEPRAAYLACAGSLYAVDPQDGTHEPLTDTSWGGGPMAVMGGRLFVFDPDGHLYRIDL